MLGLPSSSWENWETGRGAGGCGVEAAIMWLCGLCFRPHPSPPKLLRPLLSTVMFPRIRGDPSRRNQKVNAMATGLVLDISRRLALAHNFPTIHQQNSVSFHLHATTL